jgi:Flp pilus assembly protein TadD
MEFDSRLVRTLMELGIIASIYQWKDDAEKIFNGLRSMRPEAEEPFIGLALMSMASGEYEETVRMLRDEALKVHPESELLKAFLALALKLSGNSHESEKIAKQIASSGKHPSAVRLATGILQEA